MQPEQHSLKGLVALADGVGSIFLIKPGEDDYESLTVAINIPSVCITANDSEVARYVAWKNKEIVTQDSVWTHEMYVNFILISLYHSSNHCTQVYLYWWVYHILNFVEKKWQKNITY